MNFRFSPVFAVMTVCLISASAVAQPPGRGPGGFGRGDIGFLSNPAIQDELDLSDEQKEEIQAVGEESRNMMRELFAGIRDIPREERREKMEELREEMQEKMAASGEKVSAVLLEPQKKRLQQIKTQAEMRREGGRGDVSGLLAPQMIEKLELTDDQAEELRAKAEELRVKLAKQIADLQKEARDELLDMLDPQQKAMYEEMMGDPFDTSAAFQRRGRGGDWAGRGRGRDRGEGGGGDRGQRPERPAQEDDDAEE